MLFDPLLDPPPTSSSYDEPVRSSRVVNVTATLKAGSPEGLHNQLPPKHEQSSKHMKYCDWIFYVMKETPHTHGHTLMAHSCM